MENHKIHPARRGPALASIHDRSAQPLRGGGVFSDIYKSLKSILPNISILPQFSSCSETPEPYGMIIIP